MAKKRFDGNWGRAILVPATFYVDCPKCHEGMTEPRSGSYAWATDDLYRVHHEALIQPFVCDTPGCQVTVQIPLPPNSSVR